MSDDNFNPNEVNDAIAISNTGAENVSSAATKQAAKKATKKVAKKSAKKATKQATKKSAKKSAKKTASKSTNKTSNAKKSTEQSQNFAQDNISSNANQANDKSTQDFNNDSNADSDNQDSAYNQDKYSSNFRNDFKFEDHTQSFIDHAQKSLEELTLALDHAGAMMVQKSISLLFKADQKATEFSKKAQKSYCDAEKWCKDNPILATVGLSAVVGILGKALSKR